MTFSLFVPLCLCTFVPVGMPPAEIELPEDGGFNPGQRLMNFHRRVFFLLLCFLPLSVWPCFAEELLIDDFSAGLSPGWHEKSFVGHTVYRPVFIDGRHALQAESRASASGLFFEKEIDPKKMPVLSWSWKIEHVLPKGDATTKQGDDYAARIYVVFPSFFFWKTKAINYIWANRLPKGTAIASSYTSNSAMIAVESGNALSGSWQEERRNIFDDFRNFFKEEPPEIGAIAIMTDTDNTGESAVAYYGPIKMLSR